MLKILKEGYSPRALLVEAVDTETGVHYSVSRDTDGNITNVFPLMADGTFNASMSKRMGSDMQIRVRNVFKTTDIGLIDNLKFHDPDDEDDPDNYEEIIYERVTDSDNEYV